MIVRAELRDISPNDFRDWDSFAAIQSDDPWDDSGWFTLSIGPSGDAGSEFFQVQIATPAAATRLRTARGEFRGILVDQFDAESVLKAVHDYLHSLPLGSWRDIARELRRNTTWEYEGYPGIS